MVGHMLSPVLMRSSSPHMAVIVILSSKDGMKQREDLADKASSFPTYSHPAGARTSSGSASLQRDVSPKAIISAGSRFEVPGGLIVCLSQ